MTERFDPAHFFDTFPKFVETSQTGRVPDRLNARYLTLIHANRHLLEGATVIDLASHDGRFTFAALQNGARHVIGIEAEAQLVAKSRANLELYGAAPDRFEFVEGDIFDELERVPVCDVVFCFGILYHVNDHMLLLSRIAARDPRHVIIDTNVARSDRAVIEIRNPLTGYPPVLGAQIEGYPSRPALDAMMSSFGWSYDYVDWPASELVTREQMNDYRVGRRVTVVVDCHRSPLPEADREAAVRAVFDRQGGRSSQWATIVAVASEVGTTPQALCVWVRRAERERSRDRDRR